MFPPVYTDNIGRSYCQYHGLDNCHQCMVDFTQVNRFAEENAGLRPKPSRADELVEEKSMVQRGIDFILSQDPATQAMMRENLLYHQSELHRIETELAELKGSAAGASDTTSGIRGWRAVLGASSDHLALFRLFLGGLLVLELVLRFRFLRPFYSDEGTLPLRLLMDKVDDVYKLACVHCRFGDLWEQYAILAVQVVFALMFTLGICTRLAAAVSWFLYFSLTLRNTWMSYILDRYFHYLLFLSIFMPWSEPKKSWNITPATVALKILLCWIYFDAGYGKFMDPLGGWTYAADPLPALDTYARHTLPAQYLYALLGPEGLRVMTPVVVWVELLAMPVALLGLHLAWKWMVYLAVVLIVSMHVGIAVSLRNSALLSFVACTPWFLLLPPSADSFICASRSTWTKIWYSISFICLLAMAAGNVWLYSDRCDQSVKHIWSTLLHNRWNVFVGAEEYVTWEIAPGELLDGSIVDVWGRRDEVNWQLPGDGAPCTATARPGRWRSFPYLAGLDNEDGEALWSYLCKEWDRENKVDAANPDRHLVRFNFFMLQADVLPNMAFSETRKRLIHSYECSSIGERVNASAGGFDEDTALDEIAQEKVTESLEDDEAYRLESRKMLDESQPDADIEFTDSADDAQMESNTVEQDHQHAGTEQYEDGHDENTYDAGSAQEAIYGAMEQENAGDADNNEEGAADSYEGGEEGELEDRSGEGSDAAIGEGQERSYENTGNYEHDEGAELEDQSDGGPDTAIDADEQERSYDSEFADSESEVDAGEVELEEQFEGSDTFVEEDHEASNDMEIAESYEDTEESALEGSDISFDEGQEESLKDEREIDSEQESGFEAEL